jgi:hypothetical protein
MKKLMFLFWVGLVVLGFVFVGNAADRHQSAYPVQVAKQESRWDATDPGGLRSAEAKTESHAILVATAESKIRRIQLYVPTCA